MMHPTSRAVARPASALACLLALASVTAAQDWPHWRGPRFDGSAEATDLPVRFGPDEGVRWAADLPGPGAGTPIVVGKHVYGTAIVPDPGLLLATCHDRETGKLVWEVVAGSGYRAGGKGTATELHGRSNYASPSAVANEDVAIFTFGNGDLVAIRPDGTPLWGRNLQKDFGDFALQWTFAASPTLWEGRLHLPVLQRDQPANGLGKAGAESFLLALDPESGEVLYRHVRPSPAVVESREAYASMIPHVGPNGRKELLVVGGDVVTGHDPASGKELWRWGTWNEGHRQQWWRVVPSPVAGSGVVLACAPKGEPVFAVELGGKGTLDDDAVRWRSSGRRNPLTSDVPTPLFYDGRFYVLSDLREALSRVDPATGEADWTVELPGGELWRASPTGADGKVYCINHVGLVVVLDAETGEILAENPMGEDEERVRASIAVAHGALFLRTSERLYCVGAAER